MDPPRTYWDGVSEFEKNPKNLDLAQRQGLTPAGNADGYETSQNKSQNLTGIPWQHMERSNPGLGFGIIPHLPDMGKYGLGYSDPKFPFFWGYHGIVAAMFSTWIFPGPGSNPSDSSPARNPWIGSHLDPWESPGMGSVIPNPIL